ncbi:DUF3140 domain-containing protein [Prauserella sp. PE36]|nr:DUF3140 domain-containing protein [Prauserella sp. PE36]
MRVRRGLSGTNDDDIEHMREAVGDIHPHVMQLPPAVSRARHRRR